MGVRGTTTLLAVMLCLALPARALAVPACHDRWIGTWTASPSDSLAPPLADQTVRMIVAPHLAGESLRVHLSNRFGSGPVTLGPATIAHSGDGAALAPGTVRPLLFGGAAKVTIPAGSEVVSDPVALPVHPFENLTISVAVPGAVSAPTEHFSTRQTNYLSEPGSGDTSSAPAGTGFRATTVNSANGWYFLDGIDVVAAGNVGAVATFGDSITDGFQGRLSPVTEDLTYIDRNLRYPDDLQRRLIAAGRPLTVINTGISGNRVRENGQIPQFGPRALDRVQPDVIAQPGVTDVIVLEGINDIGQTNGITSADVIAGLRQLVGKLHAAGLRVLLGTLTPSGGTVVSSYGSSDANAIRQRVNAWIRGQRESDAVIDFDAAVRDPSDPARIAPAFDGSDHLHFSPAGYQRLADAVDLAHLHGVSCAPTPAAARARLRLGVRPGVVTAGRPVLFRFRVRRGTAAVRHAAVRLHGHRVLTDSHGNATMRVRLPHAGGYTATATAGGSRASARVRARQAASGPRYAG